MGRNYYGQPVEGRQLALTLIALAGQLVRQIYLALDWRQWSGKPAAFGQVAGRSCLRRLFGLFGALNGRRTRPCGRLVSVKSITLLFTSGRQASWRASELED